MHDAGSIPALWMTQETLRDVLVDGVFENEQIEIKAVTHAVPGHM